jgi:diaminopimelate epimerase
MTIPFLKMHGLGNDFVVIDGRADAFAPSEKFLRAVADRKRGPGCDQIIVLLQPKSPKADIYMAIYNADGSQVGACGNATRCIAGLLFAELGRATCTVETISGLLLAWKDSPDLIAVDFGLPRLEWDQIPLAREADTLHAPVTSGGLFAPCCVNMGNPHAVFFVEDVGAIALDKIGPVLENDPIFPERCNIEIAQILAPDRIRMRVWERGAGITEACGSGACATLVAAVRRGLSARRASVILDGGELVIEWRQDHHVVMIGPAALSYRGELADDFGHE